MDILTQITNYKQLEVAAKKKAFPIEVLEQSTYFSRACFSMAEALKNSPTGIIAEHKRRSPSKSEINNSALLPSVVKGYQTAGARAVSVLTDTKFFGGSLDDLVLAREALNIPLLRKDFIIDSYQIYEAKAYGADAILLIAACLSEEKLKQFSKLAKKLGLDVLLEIHNETELNKALHTQADMIGVNNRNLKNFTVSLETSKTLSAKIPSKFIKVSESGISSIAAIQELKPYGFKGFLIGEHFMKTEQPGDSAKAFIKELE